MSTLEALNRRIGQFDFISNPADERFFDELVAQILGLAERHRRDIKPHLPSAREAGAWKKAWAIYEAFVKLDNEPPSNPEATQRTLSAAAREDRWNSFLRHRTELVELIQRERVGRQMQEYIGLVEGDMDSPVDSDPETARFGDGKKPGWMEIAARVSNALGRLQNMPDTERQSVPYVMSLRRMEKEVRRLSQRLTVVEQSINPTQQENAA